MSEELTVDQRPGTVELSRLENALVVVSHLLVSSSSVDMQDVLREIAEATDASQAFLSVSDWRSHGPSELLPTSDLIVWAQESEGSWDGQIDIGELVTDGLAPVSIRERTPTLSTDGNVLTLPLLAENDRFVGFLGIIQASGSNEVAQARAQVLSVFGDLLSSYLTRTAAEQAMLDSEERSRKLLARHPDPILITHHDRILYGNQAAAALFGLGESGVLQSYRLLDFLPANKHAAFQLQQHAQCSGDLKEPFEQEIVRINGEERVVDVVSTTVTYKGLDAVQIVFRDITERKTSEERYRNFVATISEGVFRIDIAGMIPTDLPSEEQALRIARFGRLAETNAAMKTMLNLGPKHDLAGSNIVTAFPSMPLSLLEAFVAGGYRLENFEFSAHLGSHELRHFSLNAVGRLDRGRLFRIWGSCVDITARVEMERRMVAVLEEEQERIGRDLHDGVGQLLTGVRMLSENLAVKLADEERAEIAQTAGKISSFALEASQRVRDICRGLAPPQLSQEALGHSLEALCGQMSTFDKTALHFDWDHEIDADDSEVRVQFFRIAQEAVNNALKHARAENIHVRLRPVSPDLMRLEVEDDGIGFDFSDAQRTSLGLYSMHRRASAVRAQFEVQSEQGTGTIVRATYRVPARSRNLISDVTPE